MSNDRPDTTHRPTDPTRAPRARGEIGLAASHAPPLGAPPDFCERVTRALRTTDPAVLADAAAAFRGVHDSEHAYVVERIAEQLRPPDLAWLLACCDPDLLREGYEGRARVVWSIALEHGGCMVFESAREPPTQVRAALAGELDDLLEPPCPRCGAADWNFFAHADDPGLTPRGCDRCL